MSAASAFLRLEETASDAPQKHAGDSGKSRNRQTVARSVVMVAPVKIVIRLFYHGFYSALPGQF